MEVIACHINADFDTFASMIAASKLYPNARLVVPGSLERVLREAIGSLKLGLKIEKAADIDLDKVTRLILVDIRHAARIGRLCELTKKKGVDIHIYDHHPASADDIKGSVVVSHNYGSTTTILTLIIKERGLKLTGDEATVLMAGIYEDTGFLSFPSTSVEDYEASSFLLTNGAELKRVSRLLKSKESSEDIHLLDKFIESATTYSFSGVNVIIAAASIEDFSGEVAEIAHRLVEIESPDALFLLAGVEDRIHLVIRSSSTDLNAGIIAKAMGGGGHPNAASATIKGLTLIDAKEKLVRLIKDELTNKRTALEMMSAPAITVTTETPISRAWEILLNFNINAMPVVEGTTIRGVITRQVASKAIFHKLASAQVKEYMTIDFEYVTTKTPVDKIREKVFSHGQRLLPVCKGKKVVGVITRTDLLKLLQAELLEGPMEGERAAKSRKLENIMRERLPEKVFELLAEAGVVASSMGYKAYAVGGFVRDLLLRRDNLDIDIVIEGDGIEFARKFAKRTQAKVKSHSRFKTAVMIFPDGLHVDIATARLEYYERPGALPTVEMSSLKLDLYRRDFTVNTLALDLIPDSFGTLIDFFGAQGDIKDKRIRAIHNLSFVEDPTRILRAVRFSERFGFKIAKQTLTHIKNTMKLDIFKGVSGARLADELKNILEEDIAIEAVSKLQTLGVLKQIEPSIEWNADMRSLFARARDTLAWYRLLYMDEGVEVWLVLFLALTDQIKDAQLRALARRLSITGKRNLAVIEGRRPGLKALKKIAGKPKPKLMMSEVYHLLKPLPIEVILYLMEKTEDEATRKIFSDFITRLSPMETALSGAALKRLGVKEGPRMGNILTELLDKRLNNEISTKEEEEAVVRGLLSRKRGK